MGTGILKGLIMIIFFILVLYVLSTRADDFHFFLGLIHEKLGQDRAAINCYKRVAFDFTNKKNEAEEALKRLGFKMPGKSKRR